MLDEFCQCGAAPKSDELQTCERPERARWRCRKCGRWYWAFVAHSYKDVDFENVFLSEPTPEQVIELAAENAE